MRRDIMGIDKFCGIANRSVTGKCKNCLCLTSPASSWFDDSGEIGLAWCFSRSVKKLLHFFLKNFFFFFFFFRVKVVVVFCFRVNFFVLDFFCSSFDFSFRCKLG